TGRRTGRATSRRAGATKSAPDQGALLASVALFWSGPADRPAGREGRPDARGCGWGRAGAEGGSGDVASTSLPGALPLRRPPLSASAGTRSPPAPPPSPTPRPSRPDHRRDAPSAPHDSHSADRASP